MTQTATLISKEELNGAKLLEIFQQAYMGGELDNGGMVHVTVDGVKMLATAEDRGVMRIAASFTTKPGTKRQQIVELSNRINDGLIFLRACCPAVNQSVLWLDHFIDTNAGVTGLEVVDEVRRFRSVIASIGQLDTEHICPSFG